MDKQQAIDLMKSSKSKEQWNENCDKIKAENHGMYPDWWYQEVVSSGLINETLGEGSDKIKITTL